MRSLRDLAGDPTAHVLAGVLAIVLLAGPCLDRLNGAIDVLLDALGY